MRSVVVNRSLRQTAWSSRCLHGSPMLLKMAEKKIDNKLRIHLFDFDAPEVVAIPDSVKVLPEDKLAKAAPSGFRPPAAVQVDGLGFQVHRTKNNELPVYTEFKNRKARHSTVIRKVSGDLAAFEQALREVVGAGPTIRQRLGGFEVYSKDNAVHSQLIRDYLLRIGF